MSGTAGRGPRAAGCGESSEFRVPSSECAPAQPAVTLSNAKGRGPRPFDYPNGAQPAPPALDMCDVVKEYPGHPPVRALDDVSLRVERGELCAIVGPSGSGKSTLLHIIGTLEQPTSGTVSIAGHAVSGLSDKRLSAVRARLIGFVFQQFYLLDHQSALDNVANGLLYSGLPSSARRRQAAEALERVGLGHRLRHAPNELSGGERQRVAIARAIVHRPAIVLADEPTGNLDSRSSEGIMALLRELHAAGSTILVITHDQELSGALPRRISLRDGRIDGDQREVPVPAGLEGEARAWPT